ncbi:threonine/serine exporter family protein [Nakamurella leprariae]|uniref:Threonine/serine exporter family protein n=1 Tax=Nakamurella leprariae TaxID=2803911 RepID=A0A938YJN6_9ACTN|nr:threonine/serine exporter family protein [Nakamurella leprariae]MBM9469025.1 threonine/serine exporter family protein [Nakamurella leprariae]
MRARVSRQVRKTLRALGPEDTQPLPRLELHRTEPSPELVALLRALGLALLNSSESVQDIAGTLESVAAAYDVDLQVLVLPTGILFRLGRQELDLVSAPARTLRLDQIAAVEELLTQLRTASIPARDGLERLQAILRSPPRFGVLSTVLGHTVLCLGFGLVLNPDVAALPAYLVLGAFVGALRLLALRWPTLSTALPVVAAFLVSLLSIGVLAPWVGDDPLRLLTPPLVSFLPGATLTLATMELARDQIVSGASRLIWGISQLLLLVFGVLMAFTLVSAPELDSARQLGAWAPWVGVLLVGVGYRVFSSAPPGSLPFLWITLLAAYAAQTVGAFVLTPNLSGFLGGLVMVPLTLLLSRLRWSPPTAVLQLPAFWLLVPGALGFRGVSQLVGGVGAQELVTAAISLFAIALGVLVGTSLTRDLLAVRRSWGRGR